MIRFAFMLCLAFAVSGGCTVQDASARCRGGRGIGLRRLLPRNWQRNQHSCSPAACNACGPACSGPSCGPACTPAACGPAGCNVQAAPLVKHFVGSAKQAIEYPKAQFCQAKFENGGNPITVIYWQSGKQDAEGFCEVAHISNHTQKEIPLTPVIDSAGKVTSLQITINDAGVIRHTRNAVRLPYDILVHKDSTQTQLPR